MADFVDWRTLEQAAHLAVYLGRTRVLYSHVAAKGGIQWVGNSQRDTEARDLHPQCRCRRPFGKRHTRCRPCAGSRRGSAISRWRTTKSPHIRATARSACPPTRRSTAGALGGGRANRLRTCCNSSARDAGPVHADGERADTSAAQRCSYGDRSRASRRADRVPRTRPAARCEDAARAHCRARLRSVRRLRARCRRCAASPRRAARWCVRRTRNRAWTCVSRFRRLPGSFCSTHARLCAGADRRARWPLEHEAPASPSTSSSSVRRSCLPGISSLATNASANSRPSRGRLLPTSHEPRISISWSRDISEGAIELLAFYLPFVLLALGIARLPWSELGLRALYVQITAVAIAFAAIGFYQYDTRNISRIRSSATRMRTRRSSE